MCGRFERLSNNPGSFGRPGFFFYYLVEIWPFHRPGAVAGILFFLRRTRAGRVPP
ncbi:hypothetical protein [Desulfofundulus sp.]|uniref:hypothetical protein n=1 Tax=Desulfofundulus sp. TaxID=2282750 RepID=UPI003C79165C